MGLLSRLKTLLGMDTGTREPTRRKNVDVTIEQTDEEQTVEQETASVSSSTIEPDATNEAVIKGVEESEATDDGWVPASPSDAVDAPEGPGEPETEAIIEEAESKSEPGPESGTESEPKAETDAETDAEPEGESETELESTTGSKEQVPLENIKGIGPAYADRLSEAGVDHVAALAEADADDLADRTGLSAKRIDGWIELANAY